MALTEQQACTWAEMLELQTAYVAEPIAEELKSVARTILAVDAELRRLRAALGVARQTLVEYAETDIRGGGEGYGCYIRPYDVIQPTLDAIDAALGEAAR